MDSISNVDQSPTPGQYKKSFLGNKISEITKKMGVAGNEKNNLLAIHTNVPE